jgi:hypothetical protein
MFGTLLIGKGTGQEALRTGHFGSLKKVEQKRTEQDTIFKKLN